MASIVVGFSRPRKFKIGSLFIRAWQGFTPYSHVYLKFKNSWLGVDIVYQASHGMVHSIEYDNFIEESHVVQEFVVDVSDQQIREAVRSCIKLLGRPYGYLGLIRLALVKVFKLSFLKGDGSKSLHCSELAAKVVPALAQKRDPDYIEPVHIFKALEAAK